MVLQAELAVVFGFAEWCCEVQPRSGELWGGGKLKWVLTDSKTCDIIKKRSFENEKIYKFFVSFNALCIF